MGGKLALSIGAAAISLLTAGAAAAPADQLAGHPFRDAGPGATQSASAPDPAPPAGGEVVRLSNERTLSRWAFVKQPAPVHRAPDSSSEVIETLDVLTHDRTPELVLALSEKAVGQQTWVEVRFKVRPNNQTGWVKREDLGDFNVVTTFLKIKRSKFRATLFQRGRRVWSAPIGIGQRRWPTPAGRFYVRERLIPSDTDSVYGIFAFGISATSPSLTDWPGGGIIGIHGTNQPELIPGRISHGCIRVRNGKIAQLRRLMPLGTPIKIA
jgi:lipoprotein-anchoring transpeptidase ErfK/SrfK